MNQIRYIEVQITTAFRSDARLILQTKDQHDNVRAYHGWSEKSDKTNSFGSRIRMNLEKTTHVFGMWIPIMEQPIISSSVVQFGYKGVGDYFVDPYILAEVNLATLMPEIQAIES